MSDNTSNRQKKKIAQQGADALRQKPGWDPSAFQKVSAKDQLRDLGSKEKSEGAYQSASACVECVKVRESLSDDTALCQKHLAEAMGM
jgi:hypothetical protein